MYEQIPPQDLNSLHEVREQEVFKELVVSMAENGWQGRPLLVIDCEDKYVAWTGSHRIAAARKVGLLEVPCYVVSEHELLPHGVEAKWGHHDDSDRLSVIQKIGDEVALDLMWQEGQS